MAFKNYEETPSAATETDLIPTLSGVDAIIASLEINAVTGADVIITRNDGASDYGVIPLAIPANDSAVLDHKIVIPDGHKMTVESDQADTSFVANVDEA